MLGRNALVLAAALAAAGPVSAELTLEGVHWQAGRAPAGRAAVWREVKTLDAAARPRERLRARLVLNNRGPQNVEGLLLRYSLTARVSPLDGSNEGAWAVPFNVEGKRVPTIGPDKMIEVPLDVAAAVDLYFRRLARAGWRPDRIKIQAMIEPHLGIKAVQIVEDTLEIRRETAP